MKIKNIKTSKTKIFIFSILIILISGGVTFTFLINNNQNSKKNTHQPQTQKEKNKDITKKIEKKAESNDKIMSSGKDLKTNSDKPESPKPDTSLNKYRLNITTSVDDDLSDKISIRGLIDFSIQDGDCEIILSSPSGENTIRTTEILMSPTTSSCKTLNIPKSTLEKGIWKYKIRYETKELIGESSENSFEIK